jgi:hypothetical protein
MASQIAAFARGAVRFAWGGIVATALWYPAGVSATGEASTAWDASVSGFGTLGLVHSSENLGDFTSNVLKPNGAGYTHAWSSDVDSRVGAQVIATLTAHLSADVQAIAEQNADSTYRPHFEWANLKYQFTPDFSVRAGRTLLSSFLFGDSRKVGYALPWVRPPSELYGLVPISRSDGVDATYHAHFGNVGNTTAGTYGQTRSDLPGGGSTVARRQWAITDTVDYGDATAYVTYHQAYLTFPPFNALLDAFRPFGPQGNSIADRYDNDNKRVTFFGLGGSYDIGKWFMLGEWGTTNFHSALGASTAWYVSGGYRLRAFTPYVIYGAVKPISNTTDPGLNVAALPPALQGAASGLNAELNALLAGIADQRTISIGLRWDLTRNIDLKVQFDRESLGSGSAGTEINVQPGFPRGGIVNLASIDLDFLW